MDRTLHGLGDYVQLLQKYGLIKESHLLPGAMARPIAFVSYNSQEKMKDTLFICKGAHFKESYLQDAVLGGIACYVSQEAYPSVTDVSYILVSDVRRAMALLADFYYNQVWKRLHLIGITGTKGKSSTTYYVKYILDEYLKDKDGTESAVISSIDTFDGVERFESHLTTPEVLDLYRHFDNAVQSGLSYLEMEVSSQGLKYDRVSGIQFDVGCFLNLGADHISPLEHPDEEDYFQSKLKLFSQSTVACVNLDTKRADEVLAAARSCRRVITFGTGPSADVYGHEIQKSGNDILFRVRTARFSRQFRLTMPGLFNVENALAAIAICEGLGIPEKYIYMGLMKARVPGRMEIYTNANNRAIAIVDYAHNRLSFEKLFASVMAEYPGRRIVAVFGCPGLKALDRRKDLGEISGRFSQKVYLTEEDAGEEPVEQICQEIAAYVAAEQCDYSIITDRGEAIETAILECETDSVILITGKGEETRQKRGTQYVPCPSDVDYVKDALQKYDRLHHLDDMEKVKSFMSLLPALKRCEGKTYVLKYGGSALGDDAVSDTILADAAALRLAGARVVLVHGGGKHISAWLSRMGISSSFLDGYRVTDTSTMSVTEMTLSGEVNKSIVSALERLGVSAAGISGRDGSLLKAVPKQSKSGDLGRVGTITETNTGLIETLLSAGYLPVISPVAGDAETGAALNVNADDAACAIAEALKADKLLFLTDTDGILVDAKNRQTRIERMDLSRATELMESGFVGGGMLPKLQNCIHAVLHDVGKVVILDGCSEHSLLLESISQNSIGTSIVKEI
ncbi:MAG: acetylglutamate kinase [Oscillospiraceae bacterium]|jgi:acetylglutamate kinase